MTVEGGRFPTIEEGSTAGPLTIFVNHLGALIPEKSFCHKILVDVYGKFD